MTGFHWRGLFCNFALAMLFHVCQIKISIQSYCSIIHVGIHVYQNVRNHFERTIDERNPKTTCDRNEPGYI